MAAVNLTGTLEGKASVGRGLVFLLLRVSDEVSVELVVAAPPLDLETVSLTKRDAKPGDVYQCTGVREPCDERRHPKSAGAAYTLQVHSLRALQHCVRDNTGMQRLVSAPAPPSALSDSVIGEASGIAVNASAAHGDSRAKSERANAFAEFLVENFSDDALRRGVVDVAGGRGELSLALLNVGVGKTLLIDPREHSGLLCRRLRKELRRSGHPPLRVWRTFFPPAADTTGPDDEHVAGWAFLREAAVVVGLHPDQVTEPIVDWALANGRSFAVVPCCVFARLFPHRRLVCSKPGAEGGVTTKSVRTHAELCEYLRCKDDRIRCTDLGFDGMSICIWLAVDGDARVQKPDHCRSLGAELARPSLPHDGKAGVGAIEAPPCCLCVLCGLPASGKSTLAQHMRSAAAAEGCTNPVVVWHLCFDDVERALRSRLQSEADREWGAASAEVWRQSRVQAFSALDELLRALSTGDVEVLARLAEPASEEHQRVSCWHIGHWDGRDSLRAAHVLVVDDNMHYRSMRRKVYGLARTYRAAYRTVWLSASLAEANALNAGRPPTERIPDGVMARMASQMEPPGELKAGTSSPSWERESAVVRLSSPPLRWLEPHAEAAGGTSVAERIVRFCAAAALSDHAPPWPSASELKAAAREQQDAREATRRSLAHAVDLGLRREVGRRLRTPATRVLSPKAYKNAKANFLRDLKEGRLDCMVDSASFALAAESDETDDIKHCAAFLVQGFVERIDTAEAVAVAAGSHGIE